MDRPYMAPAIAVFIGCLGVWFFADALWWMDDQRQLIRDAVIQETTLVVGRNEPCLTHVALGTWEAMNELEVYRWVTACEDRVAQEGR